MASLKDADFSEIEARVASFIYGNRPLLRKWLPAGKRVQIAQSYGMSDKKIRQKFPLSGRIWLWVPRPKSVLLDLVKSMTYHSTITGRTDARGGFVTSRYLKDDFVAGHRYGGKLLDFMNQARHAEAFLHGSEYIRPKNPNTDKIRDIYLEVAQSIKEGSGKLTGDELRQVINAPYGKPQIEWHEDNGFVFSGCRRYEILEDEVYGTFSLLIDGDHECQVLTLREAKLIAQTHKDRE